VDLSDKGGKVMKLDRTEMSMIRWMCGKNKELEEASTHKSAKIHAGSVFCDS